MKTQASLSAVESKQIGYGSDNFVLRRENATL